MREHREQKFKSGQIAINFAEFAGRGTPYLLVHGITSRWQRFEPLIDSLPADRHIYAIDLRGHGEFARADTYDLRAYAHDTIAFLSGVIKEPARIVGHSLGAMTALVVAGSAPSTVQSLLLEDPPLYAFRHSDRPSRFKATYDLVSSKPPPELLFRRVSEMYEGAGRDRIDSIVASLSRLDPAVLKFTVDRTSMWGDWVEGEMRAIRCPTILLHADPALGGAATYEEAKHAAGLIKGCRLVHWPESPHSMLPFKPEAFVDLVEEAA